MFGLLGDVSQIMELFRMKYRTILTKILLKTNKENVKKSYLRYKTKQNV